jgi:hypothetical protein
MVGSRLDKNASDTIRTLRSLPSAYPKFQVEECNSILIARTRCRVLFLLEISPIQDNF